MGRTQGQEQEALQVLALQLLRHHIHALPRSRKLNDLPIDISTAYTHSCLPELKFQSLWKL